MYKTRTEAMIFIIALPYTLPYNKQGYLARKLKAGGVVLWVFSAVCFFSYFQA